MFPHEVIGWEIIFKAKFKFLQVELNQCGLVVASVQQVTHALRTRAKGKGFFLDLFCEFLQVVCLFLGQAVCPVRVVAVVGFKDFKNPGQLAKMEIV